MSIPGRRAQSTTTRKLFPHPPRGTVSSFNPFGRSIPIETRQPIAYPSPVKQTPLPLALVLLSLAGCHSSTTSAPPPEPIARPAAEQTRAAATFDFYLLNLSWSPEFCHSHPTAAECAAHSTFVLHGLWPENNDGSYPQNCSSAPGPADPSQYSDIYPDPSLLQHEWRTHGTCSGLSPDDFFTSARKAFHSVIDSSQTRRPPVADLPAARSDPGPVHGQQSADPASRPRLELRQQLPHRRRGLPRQEPAAHRLQRGSLLPRQHRPHPARRS